MGILIITEVHRRRIAKMIAAARERPVPWELMAPAAKRDDRPVMTLAERVPGIERPPSQHIILGTYRVAFSFEYQPAGLLRHLSVSSERPGKVPTPAVVDRIAKEFGFEFSSEAVVAGTSTAQGRAWLEEFDPGHYAVNIVELVEPAAHLGTMQ